MELHEFNLRFLAALDRIDPKLKHTASGTAGRHPLLRSVILQAVKEDIEIDGYEAAFERWKHFIDAVPEGVTMSQKVHIPFLPIFEEPMLTGRKTTTARTKKYGNPGDTFAAWGSTFEIREVAHLLLATVRDNYYQLEGFSSPDHFVSLWQRLHSIRGFDPEQAVYLHSFRKLEGVQHEP